jgi:hypothetical protein
MEKAKGIKLLFATAVATVMMSSCATIVSGGSPKIFIEGETKEPVTIVTEKQVYQNVQLPYMVRVSRHHLDGQRIQIKSDKYTYQDIVLEKNLNGWAFGNIVFGGLVGWGVDLLTNSVSKPERTHFYIERPETK